MLPVFPLQSPTTGSSGFFEADAAETKGDLAGSGMMLASGSPAFADIPLPDYDDAGSTSSRTSTEAAAINWDADQTGSWGNAVGSTQAWLDDFVNHGGQTQQQRNPNAGLRVVAPNLHISLPS
jgi:hypothetical protein